MSGTLDANAGVATQVSAPGMPIGSGTAASTASPGATGPGSSMSVAHSALLVIGFAAVSLVVIGVAFRRPIGQS